MSHGTRFRLSVWRPAVPPRPLESFLNNSELDHVATNQHPSMHEQIYTWEPKEDVWASLKEADTTRALQNALLTAFHPNVAKEERSLSNLLAALGQVRAAIDDPKRSAWTMAETNFECASGEEVNLWAHSTLALYNHLLWVCETFHHVPNASVTIR